MSRNWVYISTFLAFLSACKEPQQLPPADLGYAYFPLSENATWRYLVDSVVYDDFNKRIDTFTYFQEEKIASLSVEPSGDTTCRLEIWQSADSNAVYNLVRVERLHKNSNRVIWHSGNTDFLLLTFPVRNNLQMDRNATNAQEQKRFRYTISPVIRLINQTAYTNTVQLEFNFFDTVLTRYNEREWYAVNYGMVERYFEYIDLQKDSGLVYHKTLLLKK